MNYGFNIGAAGVIATMHRQDVAANNLANIQTVGFKPDAAFTIPRQAARQEDGLMSMPSNALLERLGAGVLLAPTKTRFEQGSLEQSKNPFDLAIDGEGFLTVSTGSTQGGDTIRLTRDGRLTLDADGKLVTIAGGHAVLDDTGRPITLSRDMDFAVDSNGAVRQNNAQVATLGFVDVPNKSVLKKTGDNLFMLPPGAAKSSVTPTGQIKQYAVEQSAVDPIQAMMAVQNAANSVGTTIRVMQIHDELMNRAINTLGRVNA